ncbi:MAG: sensor histidine kinase [Bacteroidota bacterium]
MNGAYLKNPRALIISGIITLVMCVLLKWAGLILIPFDNIPAIIQISAHFLAIAGSYFMLAFLINKFPLIQILGVFSLLIIAMLADRFLGFDLNPITLPAIILFWLGVSYLILPEFFSKYKWVILSCYGIGMVYFFAFRPSPNYAEVHHANFIRFQLYPIPIFAALWAFEQWRWLKSLQADKAKTELTLLKNQINPHFFFNTLNNLYGLAVEKSDLAPTMILKLSDIMRYTIYEGEEEFVPLENEVNYLEDYIDLHKIRYSKKVDIVVRKDIQHPHRIAPLLLVVPLENAFKHGVESLASDAFIEMAIKTSPRGISFFIQNNYEPVKGRKKGIGMENLSKRLALIYPDQHNLEITQTEDTYSLSLEIESDEVLNH